MMEAVNTSETSANFYQTARRNIPEDSHLHTRRLEKLKSHLVMWDVLHIASEQSYLSFVWLALGKHVEPHRYQGRG
jgi:hypothetical protein